METPEHDSFDATLSRLVRASETAAQRDVARVSLGFEARVMNRLREGGSPDEAILDQWARVFFRAAFGSLAVTAALAAVVWISGGFALVEDRVASSEITSPELWPTPSPW